MKRFHHPQYSTQSTWDIIIIGGGATGLGIALDASTRGLKTLLVEQADFAKGTSSRSTKLVHGGVRYLAQGNISLVKKALKERGILQRNANHLVEKEEFLIPCYSWFSVIKYLAGLTLYDWLSGKLSFGKSKFFSKTEALAKMPGIKANHLKGAISYFDGKFDDARLAINIAQTAIENGATLCSYTAVKNLIKDEKQAVIGIDAEDTITGITSKLYGSVIINATGIFVDDILRMNNPASKNLVRPSQGIHIVLKKDFLRSEAALMIPKTNDGRVLFAVPWYEHLLIGTTDTPLDDHNIEPRALPEEINFIISTAAEYFNKKPDYKDILSVFSGLRPLAAPTDSSKSTTKEISRDHKLLVSAKGLLTITGGKWTTYRKMAEETVDLAISHGKLKAMPCITQNLKIHGCVIVKGNHYLDIYGSDRKKIEQLSLSEPGLSEQIHPGFPHIKAEVIWAARYELAETVEDILARRLRILFINAHAAKEMAPVVARLLAKEFEHDDSWMEIQIIHFNTLADGYIYPVK